MPGPLYNDGLEFSDDQFSEASCICSNEQSRFPERRPARAVPAIRPTAVPATRPGAWQGPAAGSALLAMKCNR